MRDVQGGLGAGHEAGVSMAIRNDRCLAAARAGVSRAMTTRSRLGQSLDTGSLV
jgi:hypothetical protein